MGLGQLLLFPVFDSIVFLGWVDPEPEEDTYLCAPHPPSSFRELQYYPDLSGARTEHSA